MRVCASLYVQRRRCALKEALSAVAPQSSEQGGGRRGAVAVPVLRQPAAGERPGLPHVQEQLAVLHRDGATLAWAIHCCPRRGVA